MDFIDKINDLYNKKTYMDKYGLDVWLSIILCFIFISIILRYYIYNTLQPVKSDWINQRCNPLVIPFAGLINKPPGISKLDFTAQNFTGCTQDILKYVASVAMQPFYYIIEILVALFKELMEAINAVRAMFDKIRTILQDIISDLYGRLINIIVTVVKLSINLKDMMNKIIGTLQATLFTLMGSYLSLKALISFMVNLLVLILIILCATLVGLIATAMVPIIGSWAIPLVVINFVALIMIMIPVIIIKLFMGDVLDLSSPVLPGVPSCFAPDTPINIRSESDKILRTKNIVDIQVGDYLADRSRVTGIMKLSGAQQTMYNLKGVQVSGEHRVLDRTGAWLKVKNHPESVLLAADVKLPYLYCLLTESKVFQIGTTTYSDWDDVDDNVTAALKKHCPVAELILTGRDIHRYLDAGLSGDTMVAMPYPMPAKELRNVQVDDILSNGQRVVGVIKINAADVEDVWVFDMSETCIGLKKVFKGTRNLQLADTALGNINVMTLQGQKVIFEEPFLYHLLTTSGTFEANHITFGDYNTAIDKYL